MNDNGGFVLTLRKDAAQKPLIDVRVTRDGYQPSFRQIENPQRLALDIELDPLPARPKRSDQPKAAGASDDPVDFYAAQLRSGDAAKREAALDALAAIEDQAQRAAPAVAEALQDSSAAVRLKAATTLARIKAKSSIAVNALVIALKQRSDADLQCAAASRRARSYTCSRKWERRPRLRCRLSCRYWRIRLPRKRPSRSSRRSALLQPKRFRR